MVNGNCTRAGVASVLGRTIVVVVLGWTKSDRCMGVVARRSRIEVCEFIAKICLDYLKDGLTPHEKKTMDCRSVLQLPERWLDATKGQSNQL